MTYTLFPVDTETAFGQTARDVFYTALDSTNKPLPNVILPTGNTPSPFYKALRETPRPNGFRYLQLDEYAGLPAGDARLFSAWLARDILDPLDIRERMIFDGAAASLDDEVRRIRAWHTANGPADIAVISIGLNGHVGFNEPGSAFDDDARLVDLAPSTVDANRAYWGKDVPTRALTLGIAELRRAQQTILLLRGENKAEILRAALKDPASSAVPASYLQTQPNVTIIADEAALSRL